MKIDKVFNVESDRGGYISAAETRRVTDLLESSDVFEKGIKKIRKKYKIPVDSYGTDSPTVSFSILEEKYNEFEADCENLANELNLPDYWGESIKVFVFHGAFIAPRREPVRIWYNPNEDYITEYWFDLIINEKISKSEFLKEVEKNWPMIEKTISTLPYPKKHKMFRVSWAKRITELREIEKKTFREIADILEKESLGSENEDLINEDYVKILYHRWKKKQKASR